MFEKIKGWLGKSPPATGVSAPSIEVAVRPNPRSIHARIRHVSRIVRLMVALERARRIKDRDRVEWLSAEIEDRELALRAQRVHLPETLEGYRALLNKLKKELQS